MENETTAQPAPVAAEFEEIGTPEQLGALYGALAKAQGEFTAIAKSRSVTVQMKSGGKYTYDYAPMDELVKATRPALAKHGLCVAMPLSTVSAVLLRVTLAHEGGGRIRSLVAVPGADDIKDAGGNLTYLTRYAYRALLGLDGGEDADDKPRASESGAESGPRTPKQEEPRRAPQTPQTQARPQGQAGPKASTSAAGAPTSSAPATGQRTGASTASTPATSPAPSGELPKSQPASVSPAAAQTPGAGPASPPPLPSATPASQPSSQSSTTAPPTAGDTPLTQEQRANIYTLLGKLGIAGPRQATHLTSVMGRLGISGPKVTGETYQRVVDALTAEAGG